MISDPPADLRETSDEPVLGCTVACDIVEWTKILEPARSEVAQALQELMRRAVAAVGAPEHLKSTGDGSLTLYVGGNAPNNAFRLATWIHEHADDVPARLRIALHHGMIAFFRDANGKRELSGSVSTCFRLVDLCPPGQIIVSRQFRDLVVDWGGDHQRSMKGVEMDGVDKHGRVHFFSVLELGGLLPEVADGHLHHGGLFWPPRRPAHEQRLRRVLQQQQQLLLLGPRRAGTDALATRIIAPLFPETRVTRLRPPRIHNYTSAQFFATLTGDPGITSTYEYQTWQVQRAGGAPHLVYVVIDGGSTEHLKSLSEVLRSLLHHPGRRFSVLLAGGAQAADLRLRAMDSSVLSGMPVARVPDLTVAEVCAVLEHLGGCDPALAAELHEATGGYYGFLEEVLHAEGPVPAARATEILQDSPQVQGILSWRLNQDDADRRGERHASHVLAALLSHPETERSLDLFESHIEFAETRLFYDGLLRRTSSGHLTLRCEAVRRAAKKALAMRNQAR